MTITTSSSNPRPLIFPALPFAKLDPAAFLSAHLAPSAPSHGNSSGPRAPIRPCGRSLSQPCTPTVHTGSLTYAHGSAVVRAGDTAIVCGVRGELLRVAEIADWDAERDGATVEAVVEENDEEEDKGDEEDEGEGGDMIMTTDTNTSRRHRRRRERHLLARLSLLVPNLELATGCSPANLPSGPPTSAAQSLTQRLLTLLHTSDIVRLRDLVIYSSSSSSDSESSSPVTPHLPPPSSSSSRPIAGFWTLYIDILPLSLASTSSFYSTAWLSLLAALHSTKLPQVTHDPDSDLIITSNPSPFPPPPPTTPTSSSSDNTQGWRPLHLRALPVALSFGLFRPTPSPTDISGADEKQGGREEKTYILIDPDGLEESLCQETGTVVVGPRGRIVKLEKAGGGGFGVEELREVVRVLEQGGWRRECLRRVRGGQ